MPNSFRNSGSSATDCLRDQIVVGEVVLVRASVDAFEDTVTGAGEVDSEKVVAVATNVLEADEVKLLAVENMAGLVFRTGGVEELKANDKETLGLVGNTSMGWEYLNWFVTLGYLGKNSMV